MLRRCLSYVVAKDAADEKYDLGDQKCGTAWPATTRPSLYQL